MFISLTVSAHGLYNYEAAHLIKKGFIQKVSLRQHDIFGNCCPTKSEKNCCQDSFLLFHCIPATFINISPDEIGISFNGVEYLFWTLWFSTLFGGFINHYNDHNNA